MVLWDEESVGTVQLRDLYQGVGSTATAASASRISRVWAQPTCDAVGAGKTHGRAYVRRQSVSCSFSIFGKKLKEGRWCEKAISCSSDDAGLLCLG